MNPAEKIVTALAQHGTSVSVTGDRVRLIFDPRKPPPPELVQAAREHKKALRVVAGEAVPCSSTQPDDLSLPPHVAAGLKRLLASPPLWGMPSERWRAIVGTARRVAAERGTQALRLGWRDIDLFGLHPVAGARYDCRGLAFSVEPADRITAISTDAAAIDKPTGARLTFYRRRDDTGAVMAWYIASLDFHGTELT
jgi:hypothetical protein